MQAAVILRSCVGALYCPGAGGITALRCRCTGQGDTEDPVDEEEKKGQAG